MRGDKRNSNRTNPLGIQLMGLPETDFKITVLNIFKEMKDKIENFSRELETFLKKEPNGNVGIEK